MTNEANLVVGITSSALFDLSFEHQIFESQGLEAFRRYQIEHRSTAPKPGTALPFIRRLLDLNNRFPGQRPVEVVVLSRNDPETGLRMMEAMPFYGLDITRAFFLSGAAPYPYMQALDACLYLSADESEVRSALAKGHPAGFVLPCPIANDDGDGQLRVSFDFDGVLVNDEAEGRYAEGGLEDFQRHEVINRHKPLNTGPLMPLLQKLSAIQRLERQRYGEVCGSESAVRVSIVTARSAPAHERMMHTLLHYGIEVDELFLTGGLQKKKVLDVLQPHIFFDDQLGHLEPAAGATPCVHIPFGVRNVPGGPEPRAQV